MCVLLHAKCHSSCATNLDTYICYLFPLKASGFSESLDRLVFDIQSFSLFLLLLCTESVDERQLVGAHSPDNTRWPLSADYGSFILNLLAESDPLAPLERNLKTTDDF